MSKKEFDNLTGKPLEPLPHESKPIPDHLDEVSKDKKQSVKLNLSDYWNIAYAIFSDYALGKLSPASKSKVMNFRTCAVVSLSLILGILILLLLWR